MILRNNFQILAQLAQFDHVNHPNLPYMKKVVVLLLKNIQTKGFFFKKIPCQPFAPPPPKFFNI